MEIKKTKELVLSQVTAAPLTGGELKLDRVALYASAPVAALVPCALRQIWSEMGFVQ